MKFYVASSLQNKEHVRYFAAHLKACGFFHTYDWTKNEQVDSIEKLKKIAEDERNGVMEADVLFVLLPGGKGTHIELGMALSLHKRIYLYSPNEDIYDVSASTTFYFLDDVTPFIGTLDEFIKMVLEKEKAFILH